MTKKYIKINNLSVSEDIFEFINNEALPETNLNEKEFWKGFDKSVHFLAPKNKLLLEKREKLQQKIDDWHKENKSKMVI